MYNHGLQELDMIINKYIKERKNNNIKFNI